MAVRSQVHIHGKICEKFNGSTWWKREPNCQAKTASKNSRRLEAPVILTCNKRSESNFGLANWAEVRQAVHGRKRKKKLINWLNTAPVSKQKVKHR